MWHNGEQLFHCFYYVLTYIFMPHNMITLHIHLPYFHVSNSALFLALYYSTPLLHRRSLDTFYHVKQWDVISHPCPHFKDGLLKPQLKLGNGWIITCHMNSLGPSQHYDDVIMTMLESQITNLTVVYSIVYSGVHQRKHQSSASLAFVREIHRGPVNFPHKWPVTRKMFPFDDVIMI